MSSGSCSRTGQFLHSQASKPLLQHLIPADGSGDAVVDSEDSTVLSAIEASVGVGNDSLRDLRHANSPSTTSYCPKSLGPAGLASFLCNASMVLGVKAALLLMVAAARGITKLSLTLFWTEAHGERPVAPSDVVAMPLDGRSNKDCFEPVSLARVTRLGIKQGLQREGIVGREDSLRYLTFPSSFGSQDISDPGIELARLALAVDSIAVLDWPVFSFSDSDSESER